MSTLRPHDDESICIPSSTAARPLFPRLLLCPAPQRSSRFLLMSPPFLLFPLPLLPNPIAVARLLSDVAPCLLFPVPLLPRPIPVEQLYCNSGLTGKRSRRVGGEKSIMIRMHSTIHVDLMRAPAKYRFASGRTAVGREDGEAGMNRCAGGGG